MTSETETERQLQLQFERGRPPAPTMVLARALLALLDWAVARDADQQLLAVYDELKPVLERIQRRGK